MMFLECPAYLDHDGAVRCGLPAEVERRFTMGSSDGAAESAMIRCPVGHWFNGAIESLTWESRDRHDPRPAGVASRAGRSGGFVVPVFSAEPERDIARPNSAPLYYQGRPARLWISVMRPRRSAAERACAARVRAAGRPPAAGAWGVPAGRSRTRGSLAVPGR